METLAGNKPAWGEEWGYGRAANRYFGDIAEAAKSTPNWNEYGTGCEEKPEPSPDISAHLVYSVFCLMLIAAAGLWWIGG